MRAALPAVLLLWAGPAAADLTAQLPGAVGIDQHPGASLPQAVEFTEADGMRQAWSEDLHGHPAVLMFGYYHCPNLCSTSLDALARGLFTAGLRPGQDAEVLFLGIDPGETPAQAADKQRAYARAFPGAGVERWHFLTGDAAAIAALSAAAGFRSLRDPRSGQYAHAAGVVLLTPQGRISSYLPGVAFRPDALRVGLRQAADGRIGGLAERVLLFCYHFDPHAGRYSGAVVRLMQVLGIACALALAFTIARLQRKERR